MYGFDGIIGNEHIKNHFKKAIEKNRISHAYIIDGEKGMGKMMMAKAFAMTLLCENEDNGKRPCLKCRSCIQAMSDNNPDIIYLNPDKPSVMSIEYVRENLINDIMIRPYSYKYKIYIVNNADMMNSSAQNAILKTIEEPPGYGIIMLLTSNMGRMLTTVRSRCIKLSMEPLDREKIKEYLMNNEHLVSYQADVAAAFAAGNLGRAKKLSTSEDFANMLQEIITLLKYIKDMPAYEVVAAVKRAEEYKFQYEDYLDILILWFRDVLLYKACQDANQILFKDEISIIDKYARDVSYNGVEEILNAIYKAKIRLKANVNFDIAIEMLYLTIRENLI